MTPKKKVQFNKLPFSDQLREANMSAYIPASQCLTHGLMQDVEGRVWFFFSGETGGGMGMLYLEPRAAVMEIIEKTIRVSVCGGWSGAGMGKMADNEHEIIRVRNDPAMQEKIRNAVRVESEKPESLLYANALELPFWPDKIEITDLPAPE